MARNGLHLQFRSIVSLPKATSNSRSSNVNDGSEPEVVLRTAPRSVCPLLLILVRGIFVFRLTRFLSVFQSTPFFLIKTCFDPLFLILNVELPALIPNGSRWGPVLHAPYNPVPIDVDRL